MNQPHLLLSSLISLALYAVRRLIDCIYYLCTHDDNSDPNAQIDATENPRTLEAIVEC